MKIFVFFIVLFSSAASANTYKCEDADGKISYSDSPCSGNGKVNQNGTAKKYKGYNQEKYLEFSKEKREKICSIKNASYQEAKNKKCIAVLKDSVKSCEAGEALQKHVQQAKEDYEFACQI